MLLCCTEVTADDTKAIDAVVNADKKRLALIEERQRLEAQKGKQGEHHGERLKEVILLDHYWTEHKCHFDIIFNCIHLCSLILFVHYALLHDVKLRVVYFRYTLAGWCKQNWLLYFSVMFVCEHFVLKSFTLLLVFVGCRLLILLTEGVWRTCSHWCWCCRAESSSYISWSRLYKTNDGARNEKLLRWLENESFVSKVQVLFMTKAIFAL